ncbi:MAG: trypsin-like peptidase domain-containing protein [Chitinophagaceae bacterium]|jgi:serine protease Do|nr:trypsin-like peptidase domain-containing protein [Chitinophagaceae bacterium]
MNDANSTYELIEKYCLDLMDEREKMYFEKEMDMNPALKSAVEEYQLILLSVDHMQSKAFIRSALDQLHSNSRSQTQILLNNLKLHVNKYWKTASVAASVAFMASMLTFLFARNVYKKDTHAQVQELKGEIRSIKKGQNEIKSEVNRVKKQLVAVPDEQAKYTGTGFALSQNGYLVTNLHVLKGFDKIFVFTNDNIGHQAAVVATDEVNDLAILKITETDFRFDTKVPYAIRKANPNIAQRVYSLGYPKDDIVYNEGYISSATGFMGDSSRYQLELPSAPGVSGAPVIDEFGTVIGIVSGKQTESNGITYVIRSKALLNLSKQLPDDFSEKEILNSTIKGQNRSEQVKKIQPFVCMVKVYN